MERALVLRSRGGGGDQRFHPAEDEPAPIHTGASAKRIGVWDSTDEVMVMVMVIVMMVMMIERAYAFAFSRRRLKYNRSFRETGKRPPAGQVLC